MMIGRSLVLASLLLLCGPAPSSAVTAQSTDQRAGAILITGAEDPDVEVTSVGARLQVENVTLESALRSIEQSSGIRVAYSPALLPMDRLVTCLCAKASLKEAFRTLLEGTGFEAIPVADHVVIRRVKVALPLGPDVVSSHLTSRLIEHASMSRTSRVDTPGTRVSRPPTGTITGVVVDASTRAPLAGAQVHIPDLSIGVMTNQEGGFTLSQVPVGEVTVRVQLLGYSSVDRVVTVSDGVSVSLNFELRRSAIAVEGVVVTAMGIERAERGLGYAIQTVGAEELGRSPEVNLVQALQGQTAGVQVVQSSGRPGASSRITIRGESSLTQGGEPLFVIDGVPVSTELDPLEGRRNTTNYGEAGNRAMDLDMSNVEEISILRGAAATALYGSRAAGGAVVITTRQGRTGNPLRFDVSTSMESNRPVIEGYITDWAAGRDGYFCNGRLQGQGGWCQEGFPAAAIPGPHLVENWGPHRDSIPAEVLAEMGEVRFRDVREDYYRTAWTLQNTLRATGSISDRGNFAFGVSHLDQQDITPVGHLDRLNISANVNIRLHDALESSTSIQRMGTRNAFPNEGFSGIHRLLTLIPPNVDVTEAWREDGSPVLWAPNLPHPEWQAANDYESSEVTRWMVSQRFAATLLPGLTLSNRWGLDTYEDYRRRHDNERPWRTELGLPSGQTIQEVISRTQINNDLVLSLSPQPIGPGDVTVSGLLGGNVFMSDRTHVQARGTDIIIPDWYNVANFATQEAFAMLPTQRRLVGAYGQAMLDYRGWGYLTLTGRNDWSSTLPKDRNSYFYPSASLGLVFTDALDFRPDWMPYGKVRASVAKVGNDAPPYSLTSRYSAAVSGGHPNGIQQFAGTINRLEFPFRGQGSYLQGTQLGNPNIRPESTVEYETGLEMRLLDNRARIDLSYYTKKTFDQIFTVPSSAATGYQSIVRNAGDLRNEGWEVSVLGRVLDRPGMSLDLRANWTRNRSSVVRLAEGVTNLNLAGFAQPSIRVVEGEPYGVIWGWPFMKNCVAETTDVCHPDQPVGALLIGDANTSSDLGGSAYGFPLRADEAGPLGPAFPNWLGNLGGELRFRNLSLSALVDIRNGGQVLNFQTQYQVLNGRSILTADRGESTVIEGINVNTGEPNAVEVVKDRRYYQLMYGIGRTENQIEPAGFVKLRQVSLSYQIPSNWLRAMTRIESASVHVTGRNLATWSDFSEGDPESDVFAGVSGAGQFFRFFTAPQTRGLTVGIRAAF